jgi:2-C-methyl-D-erythritol 2,4-cyclodiphosphate synthase
VMGISPKRVSVKATTTERLGFVGRGEGCEVWAIVLIARK